VAILDHDVHGIVVGYVANHLNPGDRWRRLPIDGANKSSESELRRDGRRSDADVVAKLRNDVAQAAIVPEQGTAASRVIGGRGERLTKVIDTETINRYLREMITSPIRFKTPSGTIAA
jgi:hypothetical protein